MINIFLDLIIVITIIATIISNTAGLCCFIAIRILIPESVRVFNEKISLNTAIIIIVLLICLLKQSKKKKLKISKFDSKYLKIMILYFIYCGISLPLSQYGNLPAQYYYLFQLMLTGIFPAFLFTIFIRSKKSLKSVLKTYLIVTFICCIYGMFTSIINKNPYTEWLINTSIAESSWKGNSTNSTFVSTTTFGYYLTFSFPFIMYVLNRVDDHKFQCYSKIDLGLILICIILCRKRSAFVSVLFCFLFLFFSKGSKKQIHWFFGILSALIISLTIINIVPSFSPLQNYLKASFFFWNDNAVEGIAASGQLGSTWELRLRQFIYPFIEVKNNPILGHGYGWTAWYLKKYKLHPVLYGFETFVAQCICEYGVLGIPLFIWLFFSGYKYSHPKKYIGTNYQKLFFITFFVDIIASGFNFFYLYQILVICMSKNERMLDYE